MEISATFKDLHLMGQAGPCKNCMDSEEGLQAVYQAVVLVVVVMLDEASSRAAQKASVCVAIDLVNIFFPIPIGKQ